MGYVAELLFQRQHDFDDDTMAKIFPTSDQNSTYAFVKVNKFLVNISETEAERW